MAHAKKTRNNAANVVADTAKRTADTQKNVATTIASAADATVKDAQKTAEKAVQANVKPAPRLSAIESKAATPDQILYAGTEAAKDFITAGTLEAQKTQEKMLNMSAEGIQNLSKNADMATRQLAEAFSVSREQFDALLESGKIAGDVSRELHDRLVTDMNSLFNENVELSKDLLACRTLNDLVEVQNRALQSNLSRFFDNSARLTDAWFKLATEVAEPVATQSSQVATRINKALAA